MTTERDPKGAQKSAKFWLDGLTEVAESHAREVDALDHDPYTAQRALDFWLTGLKSLVEDQTRELDELRAEVEKLRAERDPTTLVPIGR